MSTMNFMTGGSRGSVPQRSGGGALTTFSSGDIQRILSNVSKNYRWYAYFAAHVREGFQAQGDLYVELLDTFLGRFTQFDTDRGRTLAHTASADRGRVTQAYIKACVRSYIGQQSGWPFYILPIQIVKRNSSFVMRQITCHPTQAQHATLMGDAPAGSFSTADRVADLSFYNVGFNLDVALEDDADQTSELHRDVRMQHALVYAALYEALYHQVSLQLHDAGFVNIRKYIANCRDADLTRLLNKMSSDIGILHNEQPAGVTTRIKTQRPYIDQTSNVEFKVFVMPEGILYDIAGNWATDAAAHNVSPAEQQVLRTWRSTIYVDPAQFRDGIKEDWTNRFVARDIGVPAVFAGAAWLNARPTLASRNDISHTPPLARRERYTFFVEIPHDAAPGAPLTLRLYDPTKGRCADYIVRPPATATAVVITGYVFQVGDILYAAPAGDTGFTPVTTPYINSGRRNLGREEGIIMHIKTGAVILDEQAIGVVPSAAVMGTASYDQVHLHFLTADAQMTPAGADVGVPAFVRDDGVIYFDDGESDHKFPNFAQRTALMKEAAVTRRMHEPHAIDGHAWLDGGMVVHDRAVLAAGVPPHHHYVNMTVEPTTDVADPDITKRLAGFTFGVETIETRSPNIAHRISPEMTYMSVVHSHGDVGGIAIARAMQVLRDRKIRRARTDAQRQARINDVLRPISDGLKSIYVKYAATVRTAVVLAAGAANRTAAVHEAADTKIGSLSRALALLMNPAVFTPFGDRGKSELMFVRAAIRAIYNLYDLLGGHGARQAVPEMFADRMDDHIVPLVGNADLAVRNAASPVSGETAIYSPAGGVAANIDDARAAALETVVAFVVTKLAETYTGASSPKFVPAEDIGAIGIEGGITGKNESIVRALSRGISMLA